MENKTPISFHFQPFNIQDNAHVVEKDVNGIKKKYLKGISSGINTDQHGERMTANCIKSFMDQANSGDILLYPDLHGIKASEDIGILEKAEISNDNQWMTEYRLYDESDGMGEKTLETVDKTWRQLMGLPPYKKPRQRGFSIEGFIPQDKIVTMSQGGKRVIDDVLLDGVILVPRPAYKDSIAHAVYKALGEVPPWVIGNSLANSLREQVILDELKDGFWRRKHVIMDNLDSAIEKIMRDANLQDKRPRLEILFDEFKGLMTDLITQAAPAFIAEEEESKPESAVSIYRNLSKNQIMKQLATEMTRLEKSILKR